MTDAAIIINTPSQLGRGLPATQDISPQRDVYHIGYNRMLKEEYHLNVILDIASTRYQP